MPAPDAQPPKKRREESGTEGTGQRPAAATPPPPPTKRPPACTRAKPSFELKVVSIKEEAELERKTQSVAHTDHAVSGARSCRRGRGSYAGMHNPWAR